MLQLEINVEGMHCPSCEMLIKDSLEDVEGIVQISCSHKLNKVFVKFDKEKTNENAIKKVIIEEGYTVK